MMAKHSADKTAIRMRFWVSLRNSLLALLMIAVISDTSVFFGLTPKEKQRQGRRVAPPGDPALRRSNRSSGRVLGRSAPNGSRQMWWPRHTAWCVLATLLLAPAAAAVPTAQDGMTAYRTARAALDALAAPDAPEIDAPGAAVTIRVGGQVVGYTSAYAPGGDAFDTALRGAIGDFLQTELAPRDATRRGRLAELSRAALVHVELAQELVPVGGATFAEAAQAFSPGLDGAAARRGNETECVFPDRLLASGTSASRALAASCAALGLGAQPLEELRELSGVRVFRFRALSVGQIEAGGPPVFLHRGGRVRPLTSVVGSRLAGFGSGLAGVISDRVWVHDGTTRLLGTYDPVGDAHDPLIATAHEHALAALALARWGRVSGDEGAVSVGTTLLGSLAEQDVDARTGALALLALDALEHDDNVLRERCLRAVAGVGEQTPLSDRGLVAAALAGSDPGAALALAQGVLADGGRGGAVAAAPWIVWAVRDLADVGRIPGAPALREGRELIWEHQVTRSDAGADEADLVGGIVFSASTQPLPTAQSARAAAMAAAMLGVPGLTPANERPGELARLLPTLRFLRQLSVEEGEARLYPNPQRAMSGVRLALWDHRQPIEATAMTLLAVTDTLEAAR